MNARRFIQSLTVVVALLFIGWPAQGSDQASWPMFQYDPQHTGIAPVATPELLNLRWKAACGIIGNSHLVIGPEETIWVVGIDRVTAITRDGDVKTGFVIPVQDFGMCVHGGSFAIGEGGRLIGLASKTTGGIDRPAVLFAASAEGELEWALELNGDAGGGSLLTLGPDGSIYVGLCGQPDQNRLCAVSQEGELLWSYTHPSSVTTIPAVDPAGNVYFGCDDGFLYCVDSDGLRWSFDEIVSKFGVDSAPTIDEAGNIYHFANKSGLVVLNPDGTLKNHYTLNGYSYTSPVLLPGSSVGFLCTDPDLTGNTLFTRLGPDGQEEWTAQLSGSPLCSPAADAAGNVFVSGSYGPAMEPNTCYLVKLSPEGTLATIYTTEKTFYNEVSGPCIGEDGTVYAYLNGALHAFGEFGQLLTFGISSQGGYALGLGPTQSASIRLMNPGPDLDADCYVAYRRVGGDELFFYPFWSSFPENCALEFRPIPAGATFDEIELAHIVTGGLAPGEYEWLAGLFEPGTFQAISQVAFSKFFVYGAPTRGEMGDYSTATAPQLALSGDQMGTPPTVAVRTNKETYAAGEVLDLSLRLENEGMGMFFDLYIAATLDDDPDGTLFFFPTWQTDPGFTNISFLPLGQGASLPDWTIMHLPLPDALPRGGYRFLAAFFYQGTFNLASDVAEAHWTLM
ncbi:MAG TPA: PQQ-binding-like beta-propeller repeat protein [bacterium]|nr:PQQ-binding-like beta-propeller repeat protein [bacterium]